ncbi:antitoxin VbhA family protein [Paracidovorax wautersii]|jgi:hypothetical protein|uniref:Antitoxin VbhA domain-containing protein n=1 Tax=Paracidovorax wautersii TaxID=1177982 RepID=A0A1I2F6V7_9BURK|nr:antitoxin VbhA family protein [Paracidovorax wautersii]RYH43598.1 MAG: chromosome segregation protein ParM [Alcaligenaceae bacterium]SFF00709.1 hypothetical protein SAMN04489711_109169 [Paracidovorax wautersii]
MRTGTISEAEKARRRKAVDVARGNIGLSGFKISEAHEAHAQRYVDGEIDLAEFLKPGLPSSPAKRT